MTDVEWASLIIRVGVGVTMVGFGLHQIVKPMDWSMYIPAWLSKIDPIPKGLTLQMHGVGNFLLGLLFMAGFWPQVFDWLALAWWLTILPLALYVKWSIGLRDLTIIAALAALIILH